MPSPPSESSVLVTAHRYLTDTSDGELSSRESLIENTHFGWIALSHTHRGLLYSTPGASETATFFRSAAKPFQAYPLVWEELHSQLTDAELAVTCASHTGTPLHQALTRRILNKANLAEEALRCGPHRPLDPETRLTLTQSGTSATAIHNNCSGKHAGMLFYCQHKGLDTQHYLSPTHPLQQTILAHLKQWGKLEEIPTAIDGCGAPVFYLPIKTMALLYAHLGSNNAFKPLRDAMSAHPQVVGGEGRIDTVLMQASQGAIIAKVGADGVLCASLKDSEEGLALKIADGNETVRNMAFVEILTRLGWLDANAQQDSRLRAFQNQQRHNTQGKVIGYYTVLQPTPPHKF